MKYLIISILFCFLLNINGHAQNNPPIAVNDTIFVEFNDSVNFVEPTAHIVYPNDSDPDINSIFIDTAFYTGTGFFSFSTLTTTPFTSLVRFKYKPSLNYWGLDSIQYILRDDGVPVMYDTAIIYVFVKRKTYENLKINNINARVSLEDLFGNIYDYSRGYEAPIGSGLNSIYSGNLWLAGKNQDSVYMNCETTSENNPLPNNLTRSHNHSGPIMDASYYKNYYDFKWDRVWRISRSEIFTHINNWNSPNYVPPQVFIDWPAHGDVTKGQAFYLAPFIDNNGDGVYNPYDGDYPKIKGQEAIYFIYNDIRYQYTAIRPMESEIHGMLYAYDCAFDSAINNTVFLDYTIYNRSNLTYDSTYIGFFSDIDIGNPTDDYVGCDVDRSMFYNYNGDDYDENTTPPNGAPGYGAYIPAQSVTFLKGVKQDDDGIDNAIGIGLNETINGFGFGDGIIDNEHWGMQSFIYYNVIDSSSEQKTPIVENDYYNYLTGKWMDGTPTSWGGSGHIATGGTIPAKFMFPDSSDTYWYGTGGIPQVPWSDNNSFDKLSIGATGPFTFYPDSSVEITLAFVFGRNYQVAGRTAGIDLMKVRGDSIRSYFLNDFTVNCYNDPPLPDEEPIPPLNEAHVPQAFSPNGDGNNDLLFVYGGPYPKMKFDVYDRWGELVFSTQTQDKGWDGTFRGKNVMSGVYVYLLTASFYDGKSIQESGNITLVR